MGYIKNNKLDSDYLKLVDDILENGVEKSDRTGTGTISVFGRQIRHDMSTGFPILTSKQVSIKNIQSELYWFLSGSTDIRHLWQKQCYIWDGDWYKRYVTSCSTPYSLEEMRAFGLLSLEKPFHDSVRFFNHTMWDLGPIYGKQWREFGGIDQIENLIKDIKENPDSRRLMVSAWNPTELDKMILPPCHYGFQCYTRELTPRERWLWILNNKLTDNYNDHREDLFPGLIEEVETKIKNKGLSLVVPIRELSLSWNQRSVDTLLGLPYNIASYGMLLLLLCNSTNCIPGELIGNLGDTHIYKNQIEFIEQQKKNETFKLPKAIYNPDGNFSLVDYKHGGKVNYPLSN